MNIQKNKESYLQRKVQQLVEWDKVIDRLVARADKASDKARTDLLHHITKIQVKKARIEAKIQKQVDDGPGDWSEIKTAIESSWADLRNAFLKASATHKQ